LTAPVSAIALEARRFSDESRPKEWSEQPVLDEEPILTEE
jgi:hypothetical protein